MSLTLKRHYPILLLLLLAAVISFFVFAFGGQRVVAYTTRPQPAPTVAPQGNNIGNEIALFDDGVVHTIQVIMSQKDYDKMISTYKNSGEKDYF